jgi:tRNA-splicing ligase RtcB
MGDDAVALESAGSEKARTSLFSTIHGAGRVLGRKDASVGSPAPK